MVRTYKYCVLRFRPDMRRGESVNIGVAVFCDGRVDVHLSDSYGKAQALVPGLSFASLSTLQEQVSAVTKRAGSVEERHAAIQRFGPITASPLGSIDLSGDDNYERAVARLMVDFVLPPRSGLPPRSKSGQLKKSVKQHFFKAGLLGLTAAAIHEHKVVCAFPVAEAENLFADFAFKNGIYRFAQIIDMKTAPSNMSAKFKDCCEKAVTLDKARQQFGADSQRLVLFSAPECHSPTVDAALNLMADYSSIMLNADNMDDMARFSQSFVSSDLVTV